MPAQCPAQKPHLDFTQGQVYVATVLICALPAYDAPFPRGRRVADKTLYEGEEKTIVATSDRGNYVSALTQEGVWINLWTLQNKAGSPLGVRFAATRCEDEVGSGISSATWQSRPKQLPWESS